VSRRKKEEGRRKKEEGRRKSREQAAGVMKALDYAIRTKNWELAALCLLVGAMEALEALPADAVEELLAVLEPDEGAEQARAPTRREECAPRRQERLRGKARGG
jgi:hypothetical protein